MTREEKVEAIVADFSLCIKHGKISLRGLTQVEVLLKLRSELATTSELNFENTYQLMLSNPEIAE